MQKISLGELPAKLPALVVFLVVFIVLAMSLSACSKEDQKEKNTVVINGVEKPVVSAMLEEEDGDLDLLFYLDEKKNESIEISCNVDRHFGKNIDLTQKETVNNDSYSWAVMYFVNGVCFFHADGRVREVQPF